MEISDRKPRSSLLFILFVGVDFSQQQTSSRHFNLTGAKKTSQTEFVFVLLFDLGIERNNKTAI